MEGKYPVLPPRSVMHVAKFCYFIRRLYIPQYTGVLVPGADLASYNETIYGEILDALDCINRDVSVYDDNVAQHSPVQHNAIRHFYH